MKPPQRVQWKWPEGWPKPTEAEVEYWSTIAVVVITILLSSGVTGNDLTYRLFGAGYMIIHAHGRRILAAVRQLDKPSAGGA